MPTVRSTKRLLLPKERRLKTVVERIIDDQSELWGLSNSDAIIRDILSSYLPEGEYARFHAEEVLAGEVSIMGDIARVLRHNVTGPTGDVAQTNYLPIVEFGLKMIRHKHLETAMDTLHPDAHHAVVCFKYIVDRLESTIAKTDDILATFEVRRKVSFGRSLLEETDPERFSRAPATALIQYATKDFEQIGAWNNTCAYIADVLAILDDTAKRFTASDVCWVPPDTAALRCEWFKVLESTTAEWGEP